MRKVKSMDRDRIRLFLMVACTGMRKNRRHKDANRVSEFIVSH